MSTPLIEDCVEGVDGPVAAQEAGADRVELCAGLVEGGITPSLGMVKQALARATIPFNQFTLTDIGAVRRVIAAARAHTP